MTLCTHQEMDLECDRCWEFPPGSMAREVEDVRLALERLVESLPLPLRLVARTWVRLCHRFYSSAM